MIKTLIMGVVNITPDSFSDGGKFDSPDAAIKKALDLAEDGADIIDLGAESSRPGASPISEQLEWQRLEPVIENLIKAKNIQLSVDTYKPETMLKAAEIGCHYINDINGSADVETLNTLAKHEDLSYIAMHKAGDPKTMQQNPLEGDDAISKVDDFFQRTEKKLLNAGFRKDMIWLDPGIGFGKTDEANARLLKHCSVWAKKYQLTLGVSRKSFIGRTLGIIDPTKRDSPSKMLEFGLSCMGVQMIRTHEVAMLKNLLRLL
jgi:dihydropteroate synthase